MKKLKDRINLVSLNLANWAWKLSSRKHNPRLCDNLATIKQSVCGEEADSIICLQEFIVGKNSRYALRLDVFFPDHKIIYPKGYNNSKNYASAITVMLVPKKYTYKELELPMLAGQKWFRYNYIEVEGVGSDEPVRILNIHLPHLNLQKAAQWYAEQRKQERKEYIAAIQQAIDENNSLRIPCAVVGDYNTLVTDEDFVNLIKNHNMQDVMGDEEKCKNTWENSALGGKNRIDYILVNESLAERFQIENPKVDCDPINRIISDHALLFCEFRVS